MRRGSLPLEAPQEVPPVVANLIAGLLIDLSDEELAQVVRPGGRLLASGIFHERESGGGDAFEAAGPQGGQPGRRGRLGRPRSEARGADRPSLRRPAR